MDVLTLDRIFNSVSRTVTHSTAKLNLHWLLQDF